MLYNAATDELFLPAGSMVVAMAAGNHPTAAAAADAADGGSDADQQPQQRRRQRFFIGHNAFVSCMALGGQGSLLATGQEGKQPLMRLWDCSSSSSQESSKCLAILCGEWVEDVAAARLGTESPHTCLPKPYGDHSAPHFKMHYGMRQAAWQRLAGLLGDVHKSLQQRYGTSSHLPTRH